MRGIGEIRKLPAACNRREVEKQRNRERDPGGEPEPVRSGKLEGGKFHNGKGSATILVAGSGILPDPAWRSQ